MQSNKTVLKSKKIKFVFFYSFCQDIILLYGIALVEEAALVNRQHIEIFLDADLNDYL